MYSDDWINIFKTVPENLHSKLMVTLVNGAEFTIETIFRYEANYILFRGRLSGTTDEGRTVFIPYDQICAIRIDALLTGATVMGFYGETMKERSLGGNQTTASIGNEPMPSPVDPETLAAPAAADIPADPKDIARKNLLEKIRAARSGASGPNTSRPTR